MPASAFGVACWVVGVQMTPQVLLCSYWRRTPTERRKAMNQEIGFVKINRNRYISTDEKFSIVNTGGSVWVVLKKNDGDNYNSLFIQQPFNRALEAMSQLRKAVA
jgi:hypothetical protein